MGLQGFLDGIPLPVYLVLAIIIIIIPIEIGYRIGKNHRDKKPDKSQMAQVRAIMGVNLKTLQCKSAMPSVCTTGSGRWPIVQCNHGNEPRGREVHQ